MYDSDYEFVLLCVFLFVILAHVFPFSQQKKKENFCHLIELKLHLHL